MFDEFITQPEGQRPQTSQIGKVLDYTGAVGSQRPAEVFYKSLKKPRPSLRGSSIS